jgi:4-diphosphocytidyl-2-C-methyl-D-erythritol kinase
MIIFPKAKINLGLRIRAKRPDGYHDIETLLYPIPFSDALEVVESSDSLKKDSLTVTGINLGGNPEDNLVMKALRKLREQHSLPWLRIHLHKVIPAGAGLGGGSSDAVSFLKIMNKCFELSLNEKILSSIALELGSDCPFFVNDVPSLATGRGEKLKPVTPILDGLYIVLLNPGTEINTREAYQNCHPENPKTNLLALIDSPLIEWKEKIFNDFEIFAFKKYPLIGEIKNLLYDTGALFSSMSGSGSSVYGLFPEKPIIPEMLKNFIIYEGYL